MLRVRVGRPRTEPSVALVALVDTGADLSVLPDGLARSLGLPSIARTTVVGVDGLPWSLSVYAVEMAIDGYRTILRVISFGSTPLIGRDLLNTLVVHLYGPDMLLEADFPPPLRPPS